MPLRPNTPSQFISSVSAWRSGRVARWRSRSAQWRMPARREARFVA